MGEYIGRDLLGRVARVVLPVVGIDLVAHADVAHVLHDFERTYLVLGIGLLIDGIRRAEEDGVNSQAAGKELLGEIQFHFHVAVRDVADVRMSEGVVPDLMSLAVNARGDAAEILGLKPDQKERRGRVFSFQYVQDFRGPLRIRAVIERDGNGFRIVPVAGYAVRFGQRIDGLVGDNSLTRGPP